MILVDSSIWITALSPIDSPRRARLRDAIATGEVAVADLVLMEVLRGASNDIAARRLLSHMNEFPIVAIGGASTAIRAAGYFRALRGQGITIRSGIDVMLATFCITGAHELLHDDRDFGHFAQFGLLSFR